MTVYVDWMMPCTPNRNWRWRENCHLLADSVAELLRFAQRIGCSRSWLQGNRPGKIPHFDLTAGMRAKAVAAGAVELTTREQVRDLLERIRVPLEPAGRGNP